MLEEKTMSKKVRKANVSVLAISIEEKQKAISKKLSEYKAISKKIKENAVNKLSAEKKYAKKQNYKTEAALNAATETYLSSIDAFKAVGYSIDELLDSVRNDYIGLEELSLEKKAGKAIAELDKYNAFVEKHVNDIKAEAAKYADLTDEPEV
ncbi:MAG: hypothetical protein J6K44_04545, partial [Clostridia bacterium]|nr:hypothetical protein [Clostridia bacterium]